MGHIRSRTARNIHHSFTPVSQELQGIYITHSPRYPQQRDHTLEAILLRNLYYSSKNPTAIAVGGEKTFFSLAFFTKFPRLLDAILHNLHKLSRSMSHLGHGFLPLSWGNISPPSSSNWDVNNPNPHPKKILKIHWRSKLGQQMMLFGKSISRLTTWRIIRSRSQVQRYILGC